MKNIIHYIHLHPKRARGILRISYDQFISLMEQAKLTHQKQKAQVEKGKLRVNALLLWT